MNWFTDRPIGSAQNGFEGRRLAVFPTSQSKGMPDMTDTALSALTLAWATTVIATTLFVTALAFSQFWDSTIYYQALQNALNLNV